MIRALLVGLITVIAMAAALLAAEDRRAPPLAAASAQADLVLIDKSDRALKLLQDDQVIYRTSIALGADPSGDARRSGDGATPEGEFQVSFRNEESKYYLSLRLSDLGAATSDDRRMLIHGQPNITLGALTLPGDWTDGDVAIPNAAMRTVWRYVGLGTRVVVSP